MQTERIHPVQDQMGATMGVVYEKGAQRFEPARRWHATDWPCAVTRLLPACASLAEAAKAVATSYPDELA
jgi:hypothetical protein